MDLEAKKKDISIHALNIDDITKKQFEDCISNNFVQKASLMPDAHSGYVAPIGSVIITKDYIVPAWVGYDIGCGMIACKFKKNNILEDIKKYAKEIFETILIEIPMGNGIINENKKISEKTKIEFKKILTKLENKKKDPKIFKFLKTQALSNLGSLGSGNHFIEIAYDDTNKNLDEIYLIIHSGSRGVGHKIASKYMKKAAKDNINFEETYPLNINSDEGEEYLNILDFALDFALLNRLEMAYKIRDYLKMILNDNNLDFSLWVNKNHNHAIIEDNFIIHRKGATPAKKGEKGVIPANMKDGCFLVEGLGNKSFLESSSHGAGRLLSRKDAKKNLSLDNFKSQMMGIFAIVEEKTIDESPNAYKNIYEIMEIQKDSVKIIAHLKPIINWKG